MKKVLFLIATIATCVMLSSCGNYKECPAYGQAAGVEMLPMA